MSRARKKITQDVKQQVLHETGFQCANPNCRTPLTLDIHHLDKVSDGGSDDPENLIALCPNCHARHHRGHIPRESIRAWKMLAISLNEGLGRRSLDILLALDKTDSHSLMIDGEGALQAASLIASNLVRLARNPRHSLLTKGMGFPVYVLELTERGQNVVHAWKQGDQKGVVNAGPCPE